MQGRLPRSRRSKRATVTLSTRNTDRVRGATHRYAAQARSNQSLGGGKSLVGRAFAEATRASIICRTKNE